MKKNFLKISERFNASYPYRVIVAILLISGWMGTTTAFGQQNTRWMKKFKKAKNDSIFITRHSDVLYQVLKLNPWTATRNENYKKLAATPVGGVVDFSSAEIIHLAKVIKVKKTVDTVMQASHILFMRDTTSDTDERTIETRAELVYQKLLNGADFAKMANKYSEDIGSRRRGGGLGTFKTGVMIKPFEEGVLKHRKGEVFKVWTKYGLHLVKVDENLQLKTSTFIDYVQFVKGQKYASGKTSIYEVRIPAGWKRHSLKFIGADLALYRPYNSRSPLLFKVAPPQFTKRNHLSTIENTKEALKAADLLFDITFQDQRKIGRYKGRYLEGFYNRATNTKIQVFMFSLKKYTYILSIIGSSSAQTYLRHTLYLMVKDLKVKRY